MFTFEDQTYYLADEREKFILAHFKNVVPCGDHQYSALCPAHGDSKPSLSIKFKPDGTVLIFCHAGCSFREIVKAAGLQQGDFFPQLVERYVCDYHYYTRDGQPLVRVTRWEPKKFTRSRPDGSGGWIKGGTNGITGLYRWPELAEACRIHAAAYLVEGEKDADALVAQGAVATTCLGGAGGWRDEFAAEFIGLSRVVIIADRDTSHNGFKGQRYADCAKKAIEAAGVAVKALVLPGEVR